MRKKRAFYGRTDRTTPEEIEKARQACLLRESGMKYREIAEKLGYRTDGQVQKICAKNGIKVNAFAERDRRIVEARKQNHTFQEIADAEGMTRSAVYFVCRREGVSGPEYFKPKYEKRICTWCGKEFEAEVYSNQRICSEECRQASGNHHDASDRLRRAKSFDVEIIDADISLRALYKRDNGICYLCGKPTDPNAFKLIRGVKRPLDEYPTVDHVIPLSAGGPHSWNNVKLAHMSCNVKKGGA